MNEKYTPSLEEIRRHWGLAVDTHRREERLAEFDRMIAKNRAEAKAEAWEEGLRLGVGGHPPHTTAILFKANPYK